MKNSKILVILLVLVVVWLYIVSYFYYKLQFEKLNLEKTSSDYIVTFLKDKDISLPILFDKKTNISYRFMFNQDTKEHGWAYMPIYIPDEK